jgi:hypothetical protein
MNGRRLAITGLLVFAGLCGCNGGGSSGPPPPPPPLPAAAPAIASISPTSATAGSAGFTLTVTGSNFVSGASVVWSNPGNPGFVGGPATFGSATQLSLQISAANIAIPGTVQVKVLNPDSSTSNVVNFQIKPSTGGNAQLVSTAANGGTPNGNSHDPVLSFNGRFVAFSSEATNLVSPNTVFAEAYVHDTCLGSSVACTPTTLLASAINGGPVTNPSEGNGLGGATPSIGSQFFLPPSGSGNPPSGRFIGFLSTANNLVSPMTNFQQAFLRDTCFGPGAPAGCIPITVLASVTQVSQEPNGPASEFVMASNTCAGAYVSSGTNLVSGVNTANQAYVATCGFVGAVLSTFQSATLVSAGNLGNAGDQGGSQPAINADGLFVAFASRSTNLTNTASGGNQQIYVRSTCLDSPSGCMPSTTMVSVDNSGNAQSGDSMFPAISDDGRFVTFTTQAPAVGGGVTSDVFIHDTCNSTAGPVGGCTPSTTPISVAANGGAGNGPSTSSRHAVSGDGRFVAFSSSATNLLTAGNPAAQVFVRDTCKSSSGNVAGCTPITFLVSSSNGGAIGGFNAAISFDGHFVAFENETAIFQIFVAATGF